MNWKRLIGMTGERYPSGTLHDLADHRRARLRLATSRRLDIGFEPAAAYERRRALEVIAATLTDQELEDTLDRNIERGVILYAELCRRRER